MVFRNCLLFSGTLLTLTSAASAQSPPNHDQPESPTIKRPKPLAPPSTKLPTIRDVLRKPVSDIRWDEVPVKEIFKWLRDQGFESVVPVWRTLRKENVTPDSAVTLTMTNTTVSQVLSEVLDQLSDEIRWRAIGGVLRISTRKDFEKDLYTKVYGLPNVTLDMPDLYPIQTIAGISELVEEATYTREERLDRIRKIMIDNIAPDSWLENGGVGSINIVYESNSMVVRNTPELHVMIDSEFRLEDAIPTASPRPGRTKTRPRSPLPSK